MAHAHPTTPLDALWQAPVIIWTMLAGEGLAAVLALAPGLQSDRWAYFGLASLLVQWVLLLTLGGLYLLRRPLSLVRPQRVAYVALGLLLLAAWAIFLLAWWLMRGLFGDASTDWQGMFLRYTAIAITVGLLGLAAFQNHWRTRQLAVRAKQSELEALQARIRPHFLFNTLNTGAALVHQRPGEAERLLLDLADLFRAALAGPREIPLTEELALARRYLEIESLRFGDRLRVDWHLPEALPGVKVPALSIQPLVENAIRHGVEPSSSGGDVHIEAGQTNDAAWIVIRNSLPTSPVRPSTGHQVGLNSVRARVHAMTEGRGSVETRVTEGHYLATVTIPLGT
jgi:two-component system sensor histidine kinase AlgZ